MNPWGALSYLTFGFYSPTSGLSNGYTEFDKSEPHSLTSSEETDDDASTRDWKLLDQLWDIVTDKGVEVSDELKQQIEIALCYRDEDGHWIETEA